MSLIQEEVVTNEDLAQQAEDAPSPEPVKKTRTKKAADPEAQAKKAAEKAEKEAARALKKAEREAAKANKQPADTSIRAGALRYAMTDIVTLLVDANPKRGASADRFAGYKSGQTVAEALAAGLKRADIVWDAGRGYISVSKPE